MWCVGKIDKEYKEKMEDVLNLYNKPYNPKEPVVCIDEKPVQLLLDSRPVIPARKEGEILKRDSEYKRNGTANIFGIVEPKTGEYLTYATENRKGPEYAKAVNKILRHYPHAKKIHLVQDNLNTHTEKSLTNYYGEKKGMKKWKRFVIHYTPKHGSWLDQAEIALSIYSRQCLKGRRIGTLEKLKEETNIWKNKANRNKKAIQWKFTTKEARKVFKYKRI